MLSHASFIHAHFPGALPGLFMPQNPVMPAITSTSAANEQQNTASNCFASGGQQRNRFPKWGPSGLLISAPPTGDSCKCGSTWLFPPGLSVSVSYIFVQWFNYGFPYCFRIQHMTLPVLSVQIWKVTYKTHIWSWNEKKGVDNFCFNRCLPMGWFSTCTSFEALSTSLEWLLLHKVRGPQQCQTF